MRPKLDSGLPRDHMPMHKLGSQNEYSFQSSSHLPFYKQILLCMGLDRLAGTGMRLSVNSNDEMVVLTEYNDSNV